MGKIVRVENRKPDSKSFLDVLIGKDNDGWIEFGTDKRNEQWWVKIVRSNKK